MTPLSVVIITFNEERNIARCLESVLSVADEIIVLDSFSTDGTESICRNYNVRFYQHQFEGYSQQKNRANSYANYPYILSLDADEALTDELKKSILSEKENFKFVSYSFNRLTNYCGKLIRHSGWYPDRKIRIWKKDAAHWEGLIHEKLLFSEEGTEGFLKGDLLHYSYYSIQEHIAQSNKFSTIGALNSIKRGQKSNLLKVILFPFWRFIRNYFIKLGILDGYYGFVVCVIISLENFLKYVKMIELQNKP